MKMHLQAKCLYCVCVDWVLLENICWLQFWRKSWQHFIQPRWENISSIKNDFRSNAVQSGSQKKFSDLARNDPKIVSKRGYIKINHCKYNRECSDRVQINMNLERVLTCDSVHLWHFGYMFNKISSCEFSVKALCLSA